MPSVAELAADATVAPFLAVGTADALPGAAAEGELLVATLEGAMAGAARLQVINSRSRIGDIRAVMLAPAHRGRGVGVALVDAVCRHAFGELGLHRVEAQVYAFNAAALKTFERAGFTREGVRRQAFLRSGGWQDGVHLGRLADDA